MWLSQLIGSIFKPKAKNKFLVYITICNHGKHLIDSERFNSSEEAHKRYEQLKKELLQKDILPGKKYKLAVWEQLGGSFITIKEIEL